MMVRSQYTQVVAISTSPPFGDCRAVELRFCAGQRTEATLTNIHSLSVQAEKSTPFENVSHLLCDHVLGHDAFH